MAAYYYVSEKKARLDFFLGIKIREANKEYKKLLKELPNGLLILDQNNTPQFTNLFMEGIAQEMAPSGNNFVSEPGRRLNTQSADAVIFYYIYIIRSRNALRANLA
jgi:hypothetical protein